MTHLTHRVLACRRFAAALAAAALLLPLPAARAAEKPFAESAEVVVVEVPVQVVDGGEPVRGLTAANFEVFDGRKKVAVTGFEVLDLASTPAASPVDVPSAARRHFMMLFDLTFSDPTSLLRAREAAKEVVKTLHPADLLAVTTYSTMQGPQMVLGFTPDRAQAVAAIDTLGHVEALQPRARPVAAGDEHRHFG